ncbi:unnamed protein product [Ostreobium quekettii]|uniref:Plant heme peroxidase family profile domain-containing protein n=1 Tax=Ostreobium quekettii TaxID=121088 RepID=A0A8S1JCB3_9CHLO|nr:unnamed protein product [Ostreobium quekettii]
MVPGAANAAPQIKSVVPVESLSTIQARGMRGLMESRAAAELSKVLTADDAAMCLGLVVNDAGTYDVATKTGGLDGSIVLEEELSRPENKVFKPIVAKLTTAKKAIDEESIKAEQGPISWADLLVLAAKTSIQMSWRQIKLGKAKDEASAGILTSAYGTNWSVRIGRVDSMTPAPAGRLLSPDPSAEEVQSFFNALGNKNVGESGPFTPKGPFSEKYSFLIWTAAQPDPEKAEEKLATLPVYAEWKKDFDRSRKTVTRNDYEVDFVETFDKLVNLGSTFDNLAYLKPIEVNMKI